jgi:nicotinamide-nucleotide amidase
MLCGGCRQRAFLFGHGLERPPSLPESNRAPSNQVIRRMHPPGDDELQLLAERIGARLRDGRHMLVTAESCTGGWIAKTVTDVAGSSDWFDCGLAAYSYEAKQALLGVRPETLEIHGAVSRETAIEMVSGALVHSGATVAVAVTGIAGPGGGTTDKPVGTVWIAWKRRGGYPTAEVFHFDGDREAVRRQTVAAALRGLEAIAA